MKSLGDSHPPAGLFEGRDKQELFSFGRAIGELDMSFDGRSAHVMSTEKTHGKVDLREKKMYFRTGTTRCDEV